MVYKFNTKDSSNQGGTFVELSCEADVLVIESGNINDEQNWCSHFIQKSEIDNLIIALTNIKNEISEYERK
jgi:hypothetical protein